MLRLRRRDLIAGGIASLAVAGPLRAAAPPPIPIADMHAHLFFGFGRAPAERNPLARSMASGHATLVAWSLVGDVPWIRPGAKGLHQVGTPKRGEATAWFKQELDRIKEHCAAQKLKIVTGPADIDRALAGEPHVLLSIEGATFLDDDPGAVEEAWKLGIRHIQLVHYIRNSLGDFQTERPTHGGLTEAGARVIRDCNRLGILVDLAHGTEEVVAKALAVSTAPVVWSHSSLTNAAGKSAWSRRVTEARRLPLAGAKAIAAKGGVVGLWSIKSDVGATPESYGDKLLEMAEALGEDHVAFGTDMNAVADPLFVTYADLRRVVRHFERRGVPEATIRKLAIENYARVLKSVFTPA